MPRTRARASVLRTKQAWSIPGRTTSSTNVPRPASSRGSSTRCTRLPAYLVAPGIGSDIVLSNCLAQGRRSPAVATSALHPCGPTWRGDGWSQRLFTVQYRRADRSAR